MIFCSNSSAFGMVQVDSQNTNSSILEYSNKLSFNQKYSSMGLSPGSPLSPSRGFEILGKNRKGVLVKGGIKTNISDYPYL